MLYSLELVWKVLRGAGFHDCNLTAEVSCSTLWSLSGRYWGGLVSTELQWSNCERTKAHRSIFAAVTVTCWLCAEIHCRQTGSKCLQHAYQWSIWMRLCSQDFLHGVWMECQNCQHEQKWVQSGSMVLSDLITRYTFFCGYNKFQLAVVHSHFYLWNAALCA